MSHRFQTLRVDGWLEKKVVPSFYVTRASWGVCFKLKLCCDFAVLGVTKCRSPPCRQASIENKRVGWPLHPYGCKYRRKYRGARRDAIDGGSE